MIVRSRNILRLSGASPEKAPEQKSKQHQAAAVFRRFFYVLHKLDLKDRLGRKSAASSEAHHDS
jgi:hypothetical protein